MQTSWISKNHKSKWPKWPWRSRSMTSIFNTSRDYSQDACLGQIWWFQLKPVTSYRADKVKFMDGRTDRQTQATTIALRPERPRGKNYFYHIQIRIEMLVKSRPYIIEGQPNPRKVGLQCKDESVAKYTSIFIVEGQSWILDIQKRSIMDIKMQIWIPIILSWIFNYGYP